MGQRLLRGAMEQRLLWGIIGLAITYGVQWANIYGVLWGSSHLRGDVIYGVLWGSPYEVL